MQEYNRPYHEVANIFPLMNGDEYGDLKEDILKNGLLEPIWLHPNGSIIDGRNRHRACLDLGINPIFKTWQEDGSLVSFVMSLNLHRRHLTSSQRAAIAVDILPVLEEEARKRMELGINQYSPVEIIPPPSDVGKSRDQAAEITHTNGRYVSDAKKIKDSDPILFDSVRSGEISIPKAMDIVKGSPPHVSYNSGNNEWYTPEHIIEAARETMGGIDLDPASSDVANDIVMAENYFSIDDDGLAKDWHGRVWLNPPYSANLIVKFCEKLHAEYTNGRIDSACVLVNNATETAWFRLLVSITSAICFPSSRVSFWKPSGETGQPLQGQAILYIGDNEEAFMDCFCEVGFIVKVVDRVC